MTWGFQANRNPPVLHTHDRSGRRIDEVEYHPAWHSLIEVGHLQAGEDVLIVSLPDTFKEKKRNVMKKENMG